MDPLSDACLSLNVKVVESGQCHIGGCWVTSIPAYNAVSIGASLKGEFWLSLDGLDYLILIKDGDCYLVANHHGCCTSSKPEGEAADRRSPLRQSVPTEVVPRHPGECDHIGIGARLVFETSANLLFDLLPLIIHIHAKSDIAPVFCSMLHVLIGENAGSGRLIVRASGPAPDWRQMLTSKIITSVNIQCAIKRALSSWWPYPLIEQIVGADKC
jgi:hypothetical protein